MLKILMIEIEFHYPKILIIYRNNAGLIAILMNYIGRFVVQKHRNVSNYSPNNARDTSIYAYLLWNL